MPPPLRSVDVSRNDLLPLLVVIGDKLRDRAQQLYIDAVRVFLSPAPCRTGPISDIPDMGKDSVTISKVLYKDSYTRAAFGR
eukprot:4815363-Prymnesium_polylepis.2